MIQGEMTMLFKVLDRNGNCMMHTDMEKLARRFINDNPERGYRLAGGKRKGN